MQLPTGVPQFYQSGRAAVVPKILDMENATSLTEPLLCPLFRALRRTISTRYERSFSPTCAATCARRISGSARFAFVVHRFSGRRTFGDRAQLRSPRAHAADNADHSTPPRANLMPAAPSRDSSRRAAVAGQRQRAPPMTWRMSPKLRVCNRKLRLAGGGKIIEMSAPNSNAPTPANAQRRRRRHEENHRRARPDFAAACRRPCRPGCVRRRCAWTNSKRPVCPRLPFAGRRQKQRTSKAPATGGTPRSIRARGWRKIRPRRRCAIPARRSPTPTVCPTKSKSRFRRSSCLLTTTDLQTVAVADPAIADVAVVNSRSVLLNGKGPGVTSLVIVDGQKIRQYTVRVTAAPGERPVDVAEAIGIPGVSVRQVKDAVVLEGTVASDEESKRAAEIAGIYSAKSSTNSKFGGDNAMDASTATAAQISDLIGLPGVIVRMAGQTVILSGQVETRLKPPTRRPSPKRWRPKC